MSRSIIRSKFIGACAQRDCLLHEMDSAVMHYTRAVRDLTKRLEASEHPAHSTEIAAAKLAGESAERALNAFVRHREEHGC